MKDRIFLIWSGSNDVAKKVKEILETNYRYVCYIGGNSDNNSKMISIGDTVINQIKSCNQAIIIFNKNKDNVVSNNLFFELGYSLAQYGSSKIHCVKRTGDEIILPSDFDNSFVEPLDCENDDVFAEKIVQYFLERQKLSIETNKMYLISNRYILHDMLQAHFSDIGSKCSDYELAQYILFYAQASVMFQDEAKILDELLEFKKHFNNSFSDEISIALNLSIGLLEAQTLLINDNGLVYLSESSFMKYYGLCNDLLDEILKDDSGTFDEWAKTILNENLAYVCNLYAANPIVDNETKRHLYEKTLKYADDCLENINALLSFNFVKDQNDDKGIVSIFKSYIYRHMFNASKIVRPEESDKWLIASLNERKSLLRTFGNNSIDSKLYNNFRIEYYINLLEFIENNPNIDNFELSLNIKELKSFVDEFKLDNKISVYIQSIGDKLKKLENI